MDGGLSKLFVASEQLAELNEKLAIQKVAVTEKSEACEKLLAEISIHTEQATTKKQLAVAKKEEIAEQNKIIVVEKVVDDFLGGFETRDFNIYDGKPRRWRVAQTKKFFPYSFPHSLREKLGLMLSLKRMRPSVYLLWGFPNILDQSIVSIFPLIESTTTSMWFILIYK